MEEIAPINPDHFNALELMMAVGGDYAIIPSCYDDCSLVINEGGAMLGMGCNPKAARMRGDNPFLSVYGDALLIDNDLLD